LWQGSRVPEKGERIMATSVSKRERIIWISLVAIFAVISVLVFAKYKTTLTLVNQIVTDLEDEKTTRTQREINLTSQVSDLKAKVEEYNELIKNSPTNNPDIINGLKHRGFNGEVQEIIADLVKHNELIPYDGALGGKMGFYSKEKVFVLSDKWVYAYFDDGHINGYMLLSYSINNGNISWKVIDSYLFGQ
jgi:cell division protein FtsL